MRVPNSKIIFLRLGLLAFAFSYQAIAQNEREKCAEFKKLIAGIRTQRSALPSAKHPKIRWKTEPTITERQKNEVEVVINHTDSLLGSFMEVPSALQIDLQGKADNAHALETFSEEDEKENPGLSISYQHVIAARAPSSPGGIQLPGLPSLQEGQKWFSQHPNVTRSIWIHEYAHVYFEINLKPRLNYLKVQEHFRSALEKRNPELAKLMVDRNVAKDQMSELVELFDSAASEAELRAMLDYFDQLDRKYWELSKQIREGEEESFIGTEAFNSRKKRLLFIVRAMNELFADVVAGVQSGDLDRISTSLSVVGRSDWELNRVEYRRFSNPRITEIPKKSPYEVLHPVRLRLGIISKGQLDSTESKISFLKSVTTAIGNAMSEWERFPVGDPISDKLINDRLIQAINLEFKR